MKLIVNILYISLCGVYLSFPPLSLTTTTTKNQKETMRTQNLEMKNYSPQKLKFDMFPVFWL